MNCDRCQREMHTYYGVAFCQNCDADGIVGSSYIDSQTGAIVTEEMIERMVESKINSLDRKFMNSDMSQEVYDLKMRQIRNWASEQYEEIDSAQRPREY